LVGKSFRRCNSLGTKRLCSIMSSVILYSRFTALAFPFKKPAILLISYPRSGSSWIGKILSLSPDAAYLREPVNQSYQNKFKADPIIDPASDETTLKWYTRFADRAFAGIPPRNVPDVIDSVKDFSPLQRRSKTLLLKEVNPLAADFFVRRYSPRVVLILRHPAAVADSFERIGWLDRTHEDFGYLYGTHLTQAMEASSRGWCMVVFFEDLAIDPLNQYANLFSSLGLRLPAEFDRVVAEFCENQNYGSAPYEVRRLSRNEVNKWKTNLSQAQIDSVMKGYLRSPLEYYRAESAWIQQDKCR
jgi:Sulfotransferase domain